MSHTSVPTQAVPTQAVPTQAVPTQAARTQAARTRSGLRRLGVGAGFLVVLMAGSWSAASCSAQQAAPTTAAPEPVEATAPRESVTHDFVVPEGTAERLAWGYEVEIVPQPLEVRVGDRIRVRNDDSEFARLGIFDVRPGETVTMAFNTPGELEGIVFSDSSGGCGVPPSDVQTFTIDVRA